MKKLLILANQFPPMGGSGVQRTLKFSKYLPEFGIKPIIVTKEYRGNLIDETLLEEVSDDLKIYRLKPYEMVDRNDLLRLPLKLIGTRLICPDGEYFWYYFNRKKVVDIIKKEKIEYIYSTSYPYSSHLLGLYIKRMFPEIKWITDFRDEWTNNPYYADDFFKKLKYKKERKQELAVTGSCDFLITNSQFMLDNFIKDAPRLKSCSTYIPNGYDEDDFKGLKNKRNGGEKFVITHTGSLYGKRNLTEFLEGLKLAIETKDIDKDDLEIRLVGNINKDLMKEYEIQYNLVGKIKTLGYMAHRESIQMLYNSDILLLIIGKVQGAENFYSGKIFEYIRAYRPILGIVPEKGAAAQVIEETNTGTVVDPDNIVGIQKALTSYYKQWKTDGISHNPDWDNIEKYSRKSETKELSKIINNFHN